MSHFAVLVTGNFNKKLAPYHEFECTGKVDRYVKTIDTTEESRRKYAGTQHAYVSPDGKVEYPYQERFLQDGVYRCPEGWTEGDRSYSEMFTFDEYVLKCEECHPKGKHKSTKYRYSEVVDGELRTYRRTNPKSRWDWYQVGGRFQNMLRHRNGTWGNSLKVKDLDLEGMRQQAAQERASLFDKYQSCWEGRVFPVWADFVEKYGDQAREMYRQDPVVQAIYQIDFV